MKKMKRFLSLVLTLAMAFSICVFPAQAAVLPKAELVELDGPNGSIYIYYVETSDMTLALQMLDEEIVQVAFSSAEDSYILDVLCTDVCSDIVIDYNSEAFWSQIVDYALIHMDEAAPINYYVTVQDFNTASPYASSDTGGENILRQMRAIYGKEYSETLVYSKKDAYNSKVYEELEFVISQPRSYEISQSLSVASFVLTVLGIKEMSDLFDATVTAISVLVGGLSMVVDTSVLSYPVSAYYVQYGYCMGESWVSYQKECAHYAYGMADEYGVMTGVYEIPEVPYYEAAEYEFDDFETIVENAIEMYLYWG